MKNKEKSAMTELVVDLQSIYIIITNIPFTSTSLITIIRWLIQVMLTFFFITFPRDDITFPRESYYVPT